MINMHQLTDKGGSLISKAMALKVGKFVWKRGGIAGVAAIGAGYLAYHYITKKKNERLTRIDDIEDNYPGVEGEKKIVI